MKTIGLATMLLPDEALPSLAVLLIMLAGILWMISLRTAALGLIGMAVMSLLSPALAPLFEDIVSAIPLGMLPLLVVGFLLFFAGRFVRDVAVQVCGELLASMIRWIFTSRVGVSTLSTLVLGGYLWAHF